MIIKGKKIISKKLFNVVNPFTKTTIGKAIEASNLMILRVIEQKLHHLEVLAIQKVVKKKVFC